MMDTLAGLLLVGVLVALTYLLVLLAVGVCRSAARPEPPAPPVGLGEPLSWHPETADEAAWAVEYRAWVARRYTPYDHEKEGL